MDFSAEKDEPDDLSAPSSAAPAATKKTRFSESEEESSEATKSEASKKSAAAKSETPSMALTTQRLEQMTVSTPLRGDGTKTPLKLPVEKSHRRKTASSHSQSSDTEELPREPEDERMEAEDEEISFESLQKEVRMLRKRQRDEQETTNKRIDNMSQQLSDNSYDVESHARINAHLLQKKLQDDARTASLSLTIEGFPKDAGEQDRKAFAEWVLQQSNSKDRESNISLMNTRSELSNIIVIKFSSGWHRNQVTQWFLDNYIHNKKKLWWWWSMASGRETNHEVRIRKTLSEDARMRGRFLKAAMEAINEHGGTDKIEFYPSWNENAIRAKYSHDYLVLCHFSYSTATCDIFVDERLFDDVQTSFENKLGWISTNTGRGKGKTKGKEMNEGRKGSSKGVYAAMDYAFDPKIPFWCKFVCVHDWRNNIHVQQALRDEDKAQAQMDMPEG